MVGAQAISPLTSEQARRRRLAMTKRQAAAMLGAVTLVFILSTVLGHGASWVGYVQATAEASMVGGLADWFAVTALFRRPLGLPIPHTAIVVERKDQFGAALGSFVQESFVNVEVVVERIRVAGVVGRLGEWLDQPTNAHRLAAELTDAAAALARQLDDGDIPDAIEQVIRHRVDSIPLAPLAGRALRSVAASGVQDQVIEAGLRSLDGYLAAHRDELHDRLLEKSPWWLPGMVENRVFAHFIEGARTLAHEMVANNQHPLRRELAAAVAKLALDLEHSPDFLARGEQLKHDLLAQLELGEWVAEGWAEFRSHILEEATTPNSALRDRLAASIATIGRRLQEDTDLSTRLQGRLESAVRYVAVHFEGEITRLISSTVARWDARETSARLELLLGPDLQYIRINGTVVGAAAGLLLYGFSRLLA